MAENTDNWLLDKDGRRYRINGKIREYETMVRIDGLEIPQSELANYHKEKNTRAGVVYNSPGLQKVCPFNRAGHDPRCKGALCAWWNEGCAILTGTSTRDGLCPVSGGFVMRCTPQCVAYDNGCMLANACIYNTIKKEEE